MTTKLCRKCGKILPLDMFGNRQNRGKILKHTQCKKCRSEIHFQWLRDTREKEGKLFASERRYDPARADRLDEHRRRAKLGLPMKCGGIAPSAPAEDEYRNFYERDKK